MIKCTVRIQYNLWSYCSHVQKQKTTCDPDFGRNKRVIVVVAYCVGFELVCLCLFSEKSKKENNFISILA